MIMGLAIFTPVGIAGGIFFALHNMIAKTNTFLVAGIINKVRGTYALKKIGGLYTERPWLAVLFIIPAFGLAGIPPLSGFFAKVILIKAGFEDQHYFITAVAILTGLLTLYSMIKIWNEAFLKKQPDEAETEAEPQPLAWSDYLPPAILGLVTILMGIFASPIFDFTLKAAELLMDPGSYVKLVLGGG
jgi:multicomponent Na+:H+ antiporter subunit D